MLETLLESTIINTSLTYKSLVIAILVSFVLGCLIRFTYAKTSQEEEESEHFLTALNLLPVLMSTIVLLIGNNVAGAFSLAGIFSIIRFRSAPGSARNIVFILFCVGAGLACGIEAYVYGILFTVIVCIILFGLSLFDNKNKKQPLMSLKILVPENLNDQYIFDDVLEKYTTKHHLSQMRTKDLGSVYEFSYLVTLQNNANQKEFIDELRCRNGNLNISLMHRKTNNEF